MNVKLFGISREIVGESLLHIQGGDIKTVAALKTWLAERYPRLAEIKSFAISVDHEYAQDAQLIHPGSEVALIPPVSGG